VLHVTLHEHGRHIGVEADGEQHRRQPHGRIADDARFLCHGQGVQVDDSMKRIGIVLAVHPIAQCPQIVAEMDFAGGLDARQDAGHGAPG
jgi:hypothetical protein